MWSVVKRLLDGRTRIVVSMEQVRSDGNPNIVPASPGIACPSPRVFLVFACFGSLFFSLPVALMSPLFITITGQAAADDRLLRPQCSGVLFASH